MTTGGPLDPKEPIGLPSAAEPGLIWACPPTVVHLPDAAVHAWSAALDLSAAEGQQMKSLLSADELAKAARFVFEKDRLRFIARRGLLRRLLGCYLELSPEQLRFAYGPQGKPALAETRHAAPLHFSLAHSAGLALYTVTWLGEIGIDVERVRARQEWEPIADALFSDREKAAFRALPPSEQAEAFFQAWTRKEAFLKATGEGIGEGLQRVEVTLGPGELPRLVSLAGGRAARPDWALRHLVPAPGYIGAIALQAPEWALACWRFPRPRAPRKAEGET